MTWQNSKSIRYKNNPISNKNIPIRDMTNQQLRNNLQKVISRVAKNTNIHYKKSIITNRMESEEIRIEHLSQKVLKQAEKILSRHEYWKIIDHVHKLEGQEKKLFLEQLKRQYQLVRK